MIAVTIGTDTGESLNLRGDAGGVAVSVSGLLEDEEITLSREDVELLIAGLQAVQRVARGDAS